MRARNTGSIARQTKFINKISDLDARFSGELNRVP
jgi:hypothetical protein